MRGIRRLISAIGDSGITALATFAAGSAAVVLLSNQQLAIYSLVFSGWVLGGVVPRQLHLVPMRTATNLVSTESHRLLFRDALSARWSLSIAALIVLLAGIPTMFQDFSSTVVIAISALPVAILGPLQEHARANLHVMGRSFAAGVSALTGLAGSGLVFALAFTFHGQIDLAWVPFTALSAGYIASLAIYPFQTRGTETSRHEPTGSMTQRIGFLWSSLSLQGLNYTANVLVLVTLGTAALAQFESARVFAAPVLVIGTGVGNALKPRIIAAIGKRDSLSIAAGVRRLLAVTYGVGSLYMIFIFVSAAGVSELAGRNVAAGLTAARSAAFLGESAAGNFGALYLALGETRKWVVTSTLIAAAEALLLVPALLALGLLGAPLVRVVSTTTRLALGTAVLRRSIR